MKGTGGEGDEGGDWGVLLGASQSVAESEQTTLTEKGDRSRGDGDREGLACRAQPATVFLFSAHPRAVRRWTTTTWWYDDDTSTAHCVPALTRRRRARVRCIEPGV